MSIAAQCPDCCSCPQPTVEWDSRSASKTKCGFPEFFVFPATKFYLRMSISGSAKYYFFGGACMGQIGQQDDFSEADGSFRELDPALCPYASTTDWCNRRRVWSCSGGSRSLDSDTNFCATTREYGYIGEHDSGDYSKTTTATTQTETGGLTISGVRYDAGTRTTTLSVEYTDALLKSTTLAAFPAWDDDWNDTAGSFANYSADAVTYSAREARYRLRFKIPQTNTGKNYRATWIERFIPEAGAALTSVEVYSRGVYRPTVTIAAPPAGGTHARVVAVMNASGGVASIRILNPGAGYTSAPAITIASAINGGTTSTGWTATLSATGGQIAAITGGSAGNYLPTLAFSGGGGAGATATAAMDDQGGIASVTITAAGSGYTSEPTLTITPRSSASTAADLLLHLGTETARCAVWDGAVPGGYNPATPSTYPVIGDGTNAYWPLAVPTSDGTTLVANLRAVCDDSTCP